MTPVQPHCFNLLPFTNKETVIVLIFGATCKSYGHEHSGYNFFHILFLLEVKANQNKEISRLGVRYAHAI